ncbi:hypothetical protein F9K77_07060 [Ochrobactrum sp. LMG 5442]|nr:hypothetical protein F9K77_07060 [Ochrobactrum sp. LMG 5442]
MSDRQTLPPPSQTDINPPAWADLKQAKLEEKLWPDEDKLRGQKLKNDLLWHKCFGWIVAFMMVFFTTIFVVSLGVWIFHYVTSWGWLKDDQLSKIQSVVFSGSIGAIVSSYMQKQLAK